MYIHHIINEYLDYAKYQVGFAKSTIDNYRRNLRDRNLYLQQKYNTTQVDISAITIVDVDDYARALACRKGRGGTMSEKTINIYMASIRSMIKYCQRIRAEVNLDYRSIAFFKKKEHIVDVLTNSELNMFFLVPEMIEEGEIMMRNRLLIYMLYYSGLRISELTSIKSDQIGPNLQFTVTGKGGRVREVFIPEFVYRMIVRYNLGREYIDEYLFTSLSNRGRGGRLHRNSIENIIRKYRDHLEIDKKVTPHTFRHTYATDLLKKGAKLPHIQKLLGHSNIKTTQHYLHLANNDLREEYQLLLK